MTNCAIVSNMGECLLPKSFQPIITCEHGGNRIPPDYAYLFLGQEDRLNSHRGYDPGALEVARRVAQQLEAPLFFSTTSRLLVELNRSLGHPHLFSEATKNLPQRVKKDILGKYYFPYRDQVELAIRQRIQSGRIVVHLSVHSFTPVFNAVERAMDVGILYDPHRSPEKEWARNWQEILNRQNAKITVRKNAPYRGTADGFTTYLRKRFSSTAYLGIELEMNQKHMHQESADRNSFLEGILKSLDREKDIV